MEYQKAKRRLRRRNAFFVSLRRRTIQLRRFHLQESPDADWIEGSYPFLTAPFYCAKQSTGCRCSKKKPGRPKIGRGCCWGFQRSSVFARRHTRLVEHALAKGDLDPNEVLPPWGFHGELQ